MAEFSFDTSQALNAAFGLGASLITFDSSHQHAARGLDNFPNASVVDFDNDNTKSYLGTPIAFPVTLLGGSYNYYNDGQIRQKELGDLLLPATTIVDFRRSKIKRKTPISGGSGTVKELYGLDDWQIRIRGLMMDQDGKFPEKTITQLLAFEGVTDAIGVSGKLFNLLSIYSIDINEITLPQQPGYPNLRPFVIMAESTQPVELILR